MYGRPMDLISERSGTPRSFMGHEGQHSRGGSGSGSSSRASSPGGGYRNYSPGIQHIHPALRSGSFGNQGGGGGGGGDGYPPNPAFGRGHHYSNSNDSERNLLTGAQPVGVQTPPALEPEDDELLRGRGGREIYGLDRWRTGGTGYASVPGGEGEAGGYDAYRGGR